MAMVMALVNMLYGFCELLDVKLHHSYKTSLILNPASLYADCDYVVCFV